MRGSSFHNRQLFANAQRKTPVHVVVGGMDRSFAVRDYKEEDADALLFRLLAVRLRSRSNSDAGEAAA